MAKKPTKKLDEIGKKFGADREKALNDALKLIEKDFGKGSIMRLGERAEQKVQVMSSGLLLVFINIFLPRFLFHTDRKSTRLNSSHIQKSRMPSSA